MGYYEQAVRSNRSASPAVLNNLRGEFRQRWNMARLDAAERSLPSMDTTDLEQLTDDTDDTDNDKPRVDVWDTRLDRMFFALVGIGFGVGILLAVYAWLSRW